MNDLLRLLEKCEICPRKCGVNRVVGERGYCNGGAGFEIASICIHKGEEPPISGKKGICNVFFPHCNMRCIFCQNYQISEKSTDAFKEYKLDDVADQIVSILEKGINSVGFVSPTHYLPQVVSIIKELRERGYNPVFVWNSNAYELPEMIGLLEEYIDVFLPDFKYSEPEIACRFSDAPDYPNTAIKAIKKMKSLTGPRLICDDNGNAVRGMLVRHLVLPSFPEQSIKALYLLSEEISPVIKLSLMSQYHPEYEAALFRELDRTVSIGEYAKVKGALIKLGLDGWVQELDSPQNYLPDFRCDDPFEKE